jgi:hypothetical protein
VLGAHKVAYTDYRPEHRRMHEDLVRFLKCEQDPGELVETLESRQVRWVCVFPDRCAALSERIERFGAVFPLIEEDRGLRLCAVKSGDSARATEARRLVALAGKSPLLVARRQLEDAAALGGSSAVPADLKRSIDEKVARLRGAALANLGAEGDISPAKLLEASELYLRDSKLDAARSGIAAKLAVAGKLVEEPLSIKDLAFSVKPCPKDGKTDRSKMRKPLPVAWSRANEPRVTLALPRPTLVKSVRVRVRASAAWRLPELVRLVLRRKAMPALTIVMKRLEPESGSRTADYEAASVFLTAGELEMRFFTERGHTTKVSEIAVTALEPAKKPGN